MRLPRAHLLKQFATLESEPAGPSGAQYSHFVSEEFDETAHKIQRKETNQTTNPINQSQTVDMQTTWEVKSYICQEKRITQTLARKVGGWQERNCASDFEEESKTDDDHSVETQRIARTIDKHREKKRNSMAESQAWDREAAAWKNAENARLKASEARIKAETSSSMFKRKSWEVKAVLWEKKCAVFESSQKTEAAVAKKLSTKWKVSQISL